MSPLDGAGEFGDSYPGFPRPFRGSVTRGYDQRSLRDWLVGPNSTERFIMFKVPSGPSAAARGSRMILQSMRLAGPLVPKGPLTVAPGDRTPKGVREPGARRLARSASLRSAEGRHNLIHRSKKRGSGWIPWSRSNCSRSS